MKKEIKAKPVSTRQLIIMANDRISQLVHRIGRIEANQAGKDEVEVRIPQAEVLALAERASRSQDGASSSGKPPQNGEVAKLLAELQGTQNVTHNLLDDLVKKLDPIMAGPSPATPVGAEIQGSCNAANFIIERIQVQRGVNSRLREYLERIAL